MANSVTPEWEGRASGKSSASVGVTLQPELYEAFQRAAEREGRSVPNLLRWLAWEFVKRAAGDAHKSIVSRPLGNNAETMETETPETTEKQGQNNRKQRGNNHGNNGNSPL